MKLRKRRLSLALTVMMLAAMVLSAGAADTGDRSVFLPEGIELTAPDAAAAADGYALYENKNVLFSMEVPAAYQITEPYENLVLVSDEDPLDFQVHAEYVFATVDNGHFLYDAQDFADLIETDKKQLTDWVGTEELEVLGTGWGEVAGKRCFVCAFTMNDGDSSGGLYIFDGQGDFGCYCVTAFINEKAENAALYGEQLQHMVETFTVTGPYQMEGYTLYEREEDGIPVTFFAKDGVQVEDDGPDIYPVDGVYSDANIHISRSAWDTEDGMDRALESAVSLYTEDYGGHYTAQNSYFDLGRYSYGMSEVEYEDGGKTYTFRAAEFLSGGYYWKATIKYTAEYASVVNDALSDLLFSLRVNGDGAVPGRVSSAPAASAQAQDSQPASGGSTGGVGAVLDVIQAQEGFSTAQEPIGFVYGLPGGSTLLVAEYETVESGGQYSAYTDAWLIGSGSAVLLGRNELYKEVGGILGSVTVAEKGGVTYVGLQSRTAYENGSDEYRVYLPVDEQAGAFGQGMYMEIHYVLGEGNGYEFGSSKIDGASCSMEDYNAAVREFDDVDEGLPMDLRWGPRDGVMSFDGLREAYPGGAAATASADVAAPAASYADPPWDAILAILGDTMDRSDFHVDLDQQPLVSQSDQNGDGVWEVFMVFPCEDGLDVYAMENVWLIDGNGSKCVSSGVLFREVGGNNGTLSMARKNGTLYAVIQSKQPDGDSFNDTVEILSLKEGEAALGDEHISLSRSGVYGDEDHGTYIIDGGPVSRSEYESTLASFETIYTIDLLAGGDENYSDVVPFYMLYM